MAVGRHGGCFGRSSTAACERTEGLLEAYSEMTEAARCQYVVMPTGAEGARRPAILPWKELHAFCRRRSPAAPI